MLDDKLLKIYRGIPSGSFENSLTTLLSCGIISDEESTQLRAHIMMEERKKLISQHPYDIGYHEKKKLYYTYFPDPTKKIGRRQVMRKRKEDIEDLIVKSVKEGQAVTVADVC